MQYLLFRNGLGYKKVREDEAVYKPENRIGNLVYTYPGLAMVVLFLCWGSFSFLLVQAMPALVPVELKKFGLDNKNISLLTSTIPYILNMIITPIVSYRSDRLRGKWGRRIPYMMWTAPFLAFFLFASGCVPSLLKYFNMEAYAWYSNSIAAIILGIFLIGYQVFYLIVGSIIYYLYPDVIPEKYIGRFMALFTMLGALAQFVFGKYLIGYGENYLPFLFGGGALFYLISMYLMCFLVKEGTYPAVPAKEKGHNFVDDVNNYCRECYSIPFYYSFFFMVALSEVSLICRNVFNLIYATETLKLTFDEYGEVLGWSGMVGVVLSLPLGYLVDKFHSLRVYGIGLVLVVVVNVWSFFWVKDYTTFYITSILLAVVYAVQMTSTLPVFVSLLPKSLYGQFCSATALFRAGFMVIASYGGGIFLDYMGNYQYIYAWDFLFTGMALICFIVLYFSWLKRGGINGYVAPVRQ